MTAAAIRRDRSVGFFTSLVFHMALLTLGGFMLVKPVEYAIDAGSGGIEISMVAAPLEALPDAAPAAPSALQKIETTEAEADLMKVPMEPAEKQLFPPQDPAPPREAVQNSLYQGDGSSPVPGKDATTFHSSGGALTEAKPHYLKNPAPAYPLEARENGWEGVVLLKVSVDASGRPVLVEKAQSSGHEILDQSAVKTVRKWKFRPARIGSLAVDSTVLVPVRFELESSKKR